MPRKKKNKKKTARRRSDGERARSERHDDVTEDVGAAGPGAGGHPEEVAAKSEKKTASTAPVKAKELEGGYREDIMEDEVAAAPGADGILIKTAETSDTLTASARAVSTEELKDDCPVCLDPLPPQWKSKERLILYCCGKAVCRNCSDGRDETLEKAYNSGSFDASARQLAQHCPCCRAKLRSTDAETIELLESKCDEGRAWAQYKLAKMLIDGSHGVCRDEKRALELLRLAAEKGYQNAQYTLGSIYEEGSCGAQKSLDEAKMWHAAAARQGNAMSQFNLAFLEDEPGSPEWLRLMKLSASRGFAQAQFNLGIFHADCGKWKESMEEAKHWYELAADQGDTEAMHNLGTLLVDPLSASGNHVTTTPDFPKGMCLLRRAAAAGISYSQQNLENFDKKFGSVCFGCRRKAARKEKFLRCTRCRAAWYCGKKCQRSHWRAGHKACCGPWDG